MKQPSDCSDFAACKILLFVLAALCLAACQGHSATPAPPAASPEAPGASSPASSSVATAPSPDSPLILARDDVFTYTLADLEIYLQALDLPMREPLLRGVREGNEELTATALGKLRHLAFERLFTHERLPQAAPLVQEKVREAWRDTAHQRLLERLKLSALPSSATLTAFYEENKPEFTAPERRKVAVIYKVFPRGEGERERVLRFLEDLRAQPGTSENFLELARQHSELPRAAQTSGVVDYFSAGTYGPIFERYAFSTPPGELSPVFHATQGAYLLKCLDVQPGGVLPFDAVKKQIADQLFSESFLREYLAFVERQRARHEVWLPSPLPESGPADLPLLRVDGWTLTSGTLYALRPSLAAAPRESRDDALAPALSEILEKELPSLELEALLAAAPDSPEAGKWAMEKDLNAFRALFSAEIAARTIPTREEVLSLYEQRKEFYHAPAPRRFRAILFHFPERQDHTDAEHALEIEKVVRQAREFRARAMEAPDQFEALARETAAAAPGVEFFITEPLEAFPAEWSPLGEIISYFPGRISALTRHRDGVLVFQVAEVGEPRILPFEEAAPAVERVLRAARETRFYNEYRDQTLERHGFQTLIGPRP